MRTKKIKSGGSIMKKTIKLSLKKSTITNFENVLDNQAKAKVKGGIYTIQYHPCNTNEGGCIYETEYPRFC